MTESEKVYTLTGVDGRPYQSPTKGLWGGHRGTKIYGRLDCPAALRAIGRGGYVKHRVFFADETTAVAAGFRPCGTCCKDRYQAWNVARQDGAMEALISPLLRTQARHDADPAVTDAELATIIELARRRRAQDIVIGSGRTPHAIATARAIATAWDRVGGRTLDMITWPETGASWLRHAKRFAVADPDLWMMIGPATGWAQMTRRLLWSTGWTATRTLATAGIGELRTLALVGLDSLDGLAGANADGTSWLVASDSLAHLTPTGSTR